MRTSGPPGEAIIQTLTQRRQIDRADLAEAAGLDERVCSAALAALLDAGRVALDDDGRVALPADPPTEQPDRPVSGSPVEYAVTHIERRTFGPGGYRREVGVTPTDDSVPMRAIAAARARLDERYRADRVAVGLPPEQRRTRTGAVKRDALRKHVLTHGTGESGYQRWQRWCSEAGHAEWRYADRRTYGRAARRELAILRRGARREMLLAMGLTHCEERQGSDGSPFWEWSEPPTY